MFCIHKSIDIDFAHHVGGHNGACINIHGHTWKFEVALRSETLDSNGFVIDFKQLKEGILKPVHTLLDHSLALYEGTYEAMRPQLITMGHILLSTRNGPAAQMGLGYDFLGGELFGAKNIITGGIKVAVFPFSPTSERLAEWLFQVAALALNSPETDRIGVSHARIYETLHPVESVATYSAD